MKKVYTPTYTTELELDVTPWQERVLLAREKVAVQVYNYALNKSIKLVHCLQNDPEYKALTHMKEKTTEDKARLVQMRRNVGFTAFDINKLANQCRHHFKNRKEFRHGSLNASPIESPIAQGLGERAFRASENVLYGKADKVRFKRKGQPILMEGKDNGHAIMLRDTTVFWGGLGLPLKPIDPDNLYLVATFQDRVKHCGVFRKIIRERNRWYVRIVHEGVPPTEYKKNPEIIGQGRVGIDIGTSTLAECSETAVKLHELNPSYSNDDAEKRRLLRKMDRSRRANNPQNFNPDGTIRRPPKGQRLQWHDSNNNIRTRNSYRELCRKAAVKRKQEQNILTKKIMSHGEVFIVEDMGYKALQKKAKKTTRNKRNGRYNSRSRLGKAIANRAPSGQIAALERKLAYFGIPLQKVDTWTFKASQYCHLTGKCVRKQLYERWNVFDGRRVQRDLYSAFLLMNASASLDAVDHDLCFRTYEDFLLKHDEEVARLKGLPQGDILLWYVR